MNPDFPVLLVEAAPGLDLEELRAALGRAGVSTQIRPAGEDMTAFAQQSNRVSAFVYAVGGHPALGALTAFVASVRGRNGRVQRGGGTRSAPRPHRSGP
jgi:hypothetical protein